jgi:hypothetical protein
MLTNTDLVADFYGAHVSSKAKGADAAHWFAEAVAVVNPQ